MTPRGASARQFLNFGLPIRAVNPVPSDARRDEETAIALLGFAVHPGTEPDSD